MMTDHNPLPRCPYCGGEMEIDTFENYLGWCGQAVCKACKSRVHGHGLAGKWMACGRFGKPLEQGERTVLWTAQGMLDKALNTMLKRVSARQNLSVRENSKALTVAVSVKPMPMRWNMTVRDLDVLVGYALRHCSRECLMTEAESRECPLRGVLDCVPGVEGNVDVMGMCPYMGKGEET